MSRLAVEFLDQGLHRVLFDAMPMPVFVVDDDVSILECNSAAARLLGGDKKYHLNRRGGDVLQCIHAKDSPDGCGRGGACGDCMVRDAVRAAASGKRVTRRATCMELQTGSKSKKVNLRVSTLPITYQQHSYVLLILEGLDG
jgi:PAS domain-containing protein